MVSRVAYSETVLVTHPFAPIFDSASRVLILGTLPSPVSREHRFYYAHPQNRFWPTICSLWGEQDPHTNELRAQFAHTHHIALWDVLKSARIHGASDASITDATPQDLTFVMNQCDIQHIFCTGATAHKFYQRFHAQYTDIPETQLPSPSAANARMKLADLQRSYAPIFDAVESHL